jgi:coproporphyrinogen III oxidase
MNFTKKLICIVAAGATLVAAPAFADSGRDRGRDYDRDQRQYRNYDRGDYRFHNRGYDRGRLVVMQRPMFVQRPAYYAPPPVYYAEPAPMVYGNVGPAALIGAVIGGYIDYSR